MKLRQRCDWAVQIINDYDKKTDEAGYTDTGEAWRTLDATKALIEPHPRDGHPEPIWWAVACIVIVLAVLVLA